MDAGSPAAMDESDLDAFLSPGGTCVLALAADDEPYAVPVSYAYDADDSSFYLRLGFVEDSEKHDYVRAGRTARVVVYDVDGGSRSVVAEGELELVPRSDLTADLVETLSEGEFPHFELWPQSKADIDVTIMRLTPTAITGRRAAADSP